MPPPPPKGPWLVNKTYISKLYTCQTVYLLAAHIQKCKMNIFTKTFVYF